MIAVITIFKCRDRKPLCSRLLAAKTLRTESNRRDCKISAKKDNQSNKTEATTFSVLMIALQFWKFFTLQSNGCTSVLLPVGNQILEWFPPGAQPQNKHIEEISSFKFVEISSKFVEGAFALQQVVLPQSSLSQQHLVEILQCFK